jgi:hypothetical protein
LLLAPSAEPDKGDTCWWKAANTGPVNAKVHKIEEEAKEGNVTTSSPGPSFLSLLKSWLPWALVLLLAVTATFSFSVDANPYQSGMEPYQAQWAQIKFLGGWGVRSI